LSDTGNTIGNVNVKVNATGVEEANRKIDSVVTHAKQAAASVNGIGGFSAGPSMTMGGVNGPGGASAAVAAAALTSGGRGGGGLIGEVPRVRNYGAAVNEAAAATKKLGDETATTVKHTTLMGDRLSTVLGRLVGAGSLVVAFQKLYDGVQKWRNAQADLNEVLKDTTNSQKIDTTVGLSDIQRTTLAIKERAAAQREALEKEFRERGMIDRAVDYFYDNAEKRAREEQINSAERGAMEQLKARERNEASKQLYDTERAYQVSAVDGERRILEERKQALDDLKKQQDLTRDAAAKADIQKTIEVTNKVFQLRLDAERRARDAENREIQRSAAQSAIGRFSSGNGDQQTVILQNLLRNVQNLNQAVRGMR